MEQKNYMKLIWLLAFVAFAGISCWATAESLHMLLSTWPKFLIWILTVGFFIIASLGTKLIVDSMNQNIYLEKRGLRLTGGILLLIVFWLICSLPTNTHTFFYRTVINDKVVTDITATRGYLSQIEENSGNKAQAKLKVDQLGSQVTALVDELTGEIMNDANPGFGDHSKKILGQLATVLGVSKIEPLSFTGTSMQDRQRLCDAYRKKIFLMAETKAQEIEANVIQPSAKNVQEAKVMNSNLAKMMKYINDGTINLNNPENVVGNDGVCAKLNEAYNIIKKNKNFVNFSSKEDEETYTAQDPVTKVKRMVSVVDVWRDYKDGRFEGYGFIFWIVISILVDIAAFIFFDLAFKKTEY